MPIEPVTEADKPALIGIVNACMTTISEVPEEEKVHLLAIIHNNIRCWHDTRDCVFLKATPNGITTGFILIKRYRKLTELFILPEQQRKGLGSALLKAALAECVRYSDLPGVAVNSALSATGFYAANGFVDARNEAQTPTFVNSMEYSFLSS